MRQRAGLHPCERQPMSVKPSITFQDYRALTVFHSMADGMQEVQLDDGNFDYAQQLGELIRITGTAEAVINVRLRQIGSFRVELPADLLEPARNVLENCLDNSSGMKPDDDDAEDYLFDGQVIILPPEKR